MTVADIFTTLEYGPAPESPDVALAWIAHRNPFGHYINNLQQPVPKDRQLVTTNPATGQPLAHFADGDITDIDSAVAAARAAQPTWGSLNGHVRARYLYALSRQVQKHSRLLAVLETLDNGKPIRETRDIDIPLVARHFFHHAGWAQLMKAGFPHSKPIGVVGQIIPWNFPLLMLAWKVAPAIAAGNTVVLKPAEFTPLTALAFAEICGRIGLPPGVVNIVTGGGETGQHLVKHPGIDKIAFTGSTEVGRWIRQQTAGSNKRLSLELGGKSPFIVFDDADLDGAVEGVVDAIWFNQGQVCCAGSRLLVQENIADKFIAKLKHRMQSLRVGDPMDKTTDIGAIIDPIQWNRIHRLVEVGISEGATLFQPELSCPTGGCFYPPSLFTGVSPAATIAQDEIFGPVLVSMTFRTPAEAVQLANNTRYGLAASIWSENINLALSIAKQVMAGTVWINSTNLFDAASGFGGYRESGFGREGGIEGMWEYLKPIDSHEKPSTSHFAHTERVEEPPSISPSAHPERVEGPQSSPTIDRTAKLYIGGKQTRPDSGYSSEPFAESGTEAPIANRKDVRNAVEAARSACNGWKLTAAHNRAQIIAFIAENLEARRVEFVHRLEYLVGLDNNAAQLEFEDSIRSLFLWAALCDKHDGLVHQTPLRNITLAMPEPMGVLGVVCPAAPSLLGWVSSVIPAAAMGNTVISIASESMPLLATDLYQVLETSDVPSGVINILTGDQNTNAQTLAAHMDVDCLWHFGDTVLTAKLEHLSALNLKRTWCRDRMTNDHDEVIRQCTQVKNIWVPYGE